MYLDYKSKCVIYAVDFFLSLSQIYQSIKKKNFQVNCEQWRVIQATFTHSTLRTGCRSSGRDLCSVNQFARRYIWQSIPSLETIPSIYSLYLLYILTPQNPFCAKLDFNTCKKEIWQAGNRMNGKISSSYTQVSTTPCVSV